VIKRGFIFLDELGKMFHLLSNDIDYKIHTQGGMRFKKAFKSYSKNQ
jgi:hypothetical protein